MRCLLIALVSLTTVSAAEAQDRVERGRDIARTWCATCHAVGLADQPSAVVGPPSFAALAADPTFDEGRLAIAILTPHPVMPNFPITRFDIAALAAYIASLREDEEAGTPDRRTDLRNIEDAEAVVRGKALVTRDCAGCHEVAGTGPSPVSDAPAFATLSQRYPVAHLEEALAEGIMVNHPTVQMPQFIYAPHEIGAIIAYLEAIQR